MWFAPCISNVFALKIFLEFLRNRGFFRDMDLKSLMMMLGSELHNLVIFLKRIASGGKQWQISATLKIHRWRLLCKMDKFTALFCKYDDNSECFIICKRFVGHKIKILGSFFKGHIYILVLIQGYIGTYTYKYGRGDRYIGT